MQKLALNIYRELTFITVEKKEKRVCHCRKKKFSIEPTFEIFPSIDICFDRHTSFENYYRTGFKIFITIEVVFLLL